MAMQARALKPVQPPHPSPLPSLWQSPASTLPTHAPPTSTPPPYDYAIIGTGITGTLTAYHLLLRSPRARIALLDARSACSGATGRNGGHTKAASYRSYVRHVSELGREEALRIARMEYANIRASHALARELGIEGESESWEGKTVDAIYDEEVYEEGKRAIGMLRRDADETERGEGGMADYRVWGAEEARSKFHLAPEVELDGRKEKLVGAFEYVAGSIHAYRLTMGVLKKCVELGAEVYEHTPVSAIEPVNSSIPAGDVSSSESRFSLKTPQASLAAHTVIVATNGYTASLLPEFQTVIVPLRGQITAQQPGSGKLPHLGNTYSFIYKGGYEYMIPRTVSAPAHNSHDEARKEQQIVIGGGLSRLPNDGVTEYGTVDDSVLNPAVSKYLSACLPAYLNLSQSETVVQKEWTGIMGATRDGLPLVGEKPGPPGVWVAAGFNGHGMVLCARSAEALVGMICGEMFEWFPRSFEIGTRLECGEFGGRMDLGSCGVGDVESEP